MNLRVPTNWHNSLLDGPQGTCTKEVYGKLAAEDSGVEEIIVDENINRDCDRCGFYRRTFEEVVSFNQQEAERRRKCFEAFMEAMLGGELFAEN